MKYEQTAHFTRKQDLLKIFLVIGIVLANIRIENFSYQKEDYSYYTHRDNTELVIREESNEEHTCLFSGLQCDVSTTETNFTCRFSSHKYANNAYNILILILYRALASNTCYPFQVISILQLYNNWHSSSEAEPPISDRFILV